MEEARRGDAASAEARRGGVEAVEASVSLNQTVGEGDAELGDLHADRSSADDPLETVEVSLENDRVRDAVEALPERERRVIELASASARAATGSASTRSAASSA